MLEIEKSFGSNICRCTGYRPILDAFKMYAKDAANNIKIPDIEDLKTCVQDCKPCDKLHKSFDFQCSLTVRDNNILKIRLKDGKILYKVTATTDIFSILSTEGCDSYELINGNTAKGVYPNDEITDNPRVLIDISDVQDLKGYTFDQNLVLGAGNTLTEVLEIFETISEERYFQYVAILSDHLRLVAHIAVRNRGSIAGNLMIKHKHNEFQSDIFLLFQTIGAQVTIESSTGTNIVTMQKFLRFNMKGNIIRNVLLPPLGTEYKLVTFKIMPRSQNAHAVVNAGFLYKLNLKNIVEEARIVFGGLSSQFARATATENYLLGRLVFTNDTLQNAIHILNSELIVVDNPPEPSVTYRKQLALALFYKGLLRLCPDNIIHARLKTGSINLHEVRPVSVGQQIYDTDNTTWPLNEPLTRREGLIQCAGEAMYTDDMPTFPGEVHAAFVLSTIARGQILSIDASDALKYRGVIGFYTVKDIPGLNSFTPIDDPINEANEEVFCSGEVRYYNQPLALIVADSQDTANKAAQLVNVKYTNIMDPVTDIKKAKIDPQRNILYKEVNATHKGDDVFKIIKGGNTTYGQHHFPMETIVCVTKPIEEGLAVYATSQWLSGVQLMVSRALKLDQSRIDVHVRRVGGSFGIKISRCIQAAVAASLVAAKLNLPCRIVMTLENVTRAIGKRYPCSTDYEIGVNKSGVFQYINYNIYEDNGYFVNEDLTGVGSRIYNHCYNSSPWNYKCYNILTDTAKNSWFRSPGTFENIAMVEMMMEQISYSLPIDPIELRLANLDPQHIDLKEMCDTLKKNSEYSTRKNIVQKYNTNNRWKKRGLRFVFLRWECIYARYYNVNLAVFQGDGTIAISHGGVDIGQGINTKVSQLVAYKLNIPIEKIIVKENNTTVAPNSDPTSASLTTHNIMMAAEKCCDELLARIQPIKQQSNKEMSWEELIKKSFEMSVDLQAHGFAGKDDLQSYQIYGVTLAEVEIDVLTGEYEILRVDILQDVGRSVNPELDVGQVEGAFVMGLGYWTCEKLVYDKKTGEMLTDRTWNYYVPQARDIPQDMRVYLRKKSYSTNPLFGAKACSEPPICMSVCVAIAIREAIVFAREESCIPSTQWFNIDGPYTTEEVFLACKTSTKDFVFEP